MKKLLIIVCLFSLTLSCSKGDDGGSNNPPPNNGGNNTDCGTYQGYTLYKDSEGCYYTGGNYSKVYVNASNCTCE